MCVKQLFDGCESAWMLWVTPFKVKPLENTLNSFFHPAGDKRHINLRFVPQHQVVVKHSYTAIVSHWEFLWRVNIEFAVTAGSRAMRQLGKKVNQHSIGRIKRRFAP